MSQVVGLQDYQKQNESCVCWSCHGRLDQAALFCSHCGVVQGARSIDYFSRLGIERRLDLDVAELDRRYDAMKKQLDPNFFMIRTATERANAARQLDALIQAYDTLRDPVQRGRYWLKLHQQDFSAAKDDHPMIKKMQAECASMDSAHELDQLAMRTNQMLQNGVMKLLSSLRQQNWQQANETLVELDGMEDILSQARAKRQALTPGEGNGTQHTIQ